MKTSLMIAVIALVGLALTAESVLACGVGKKQDSQYAAEQVEN